MKVALVSVNSEPGGTRRHILDLCRTLTALGEEVTVDVRGLDDETKALIEESGGQIMMLRSSREEWDIWHLHLPDTYSLVGLRLIVQARMHRVAKSYVVTEHLPRTNASDPSFDGIERRIIALFLKRFFKVVELSLIGTVIVPSVGAKRFIEARYGIVPEKIEVVHHGVPLPLYNERAVTGSPARVVAVGSLSRQKGHDVLVMASVMMSVKVHIVLVGAGPHAERLRTLAERLGADIEFQGWVENPMYELRPNDIVCLPSRWESSSYAALEAMSLGLPVVASRVDGLEDIVESGITGYLVRADSPEALAVALESLVKDPNMASKFGQAGRSRIESMFLDERMARDTQRIYLESLCRDAE